MENKKDPTSDLIIIHRLVQKVVYDTLDWAHKIAVALNSETYLSVGDVYSSNPKDVSHIRHFVILWTIAIRNHSKEYARSDGLLSSETWNLFWC